MKVQWGLILSLVAALLIAIFAVINVEPVKVNYLFGVAEWPLILVILSSVLLGGIVVGSVGIVKVFKLQHEMKHLREERPTIEVDQRIETPVEASEELFKVEPVETREEAIVETIIETKEQQ